MLILGIGSLSAVNDDLALDYPELVKAVLDNTAYVAPPDLLIGLGLTSFSMTPAALPMV